MVIYTNYTFIVLHQFSGGPRFKWASRIPYCDSCDICWKLVFIQPHLMLSWFSGCMKTNFQQNVMVMGSNPTPANWEKLRWGKILHLGQKLPDDWTHTKNHRFAGSWFLYNPKTNWEKGAPHAQLVFWLYKKQLIAEGAYFSFGS